MIGLAIPKLSTLFNMMKIGYWSMKILHNFLKFLSLITSLKNDPISELQFYNFSNLSTILQFETFFQAQKIKNTTVKNKLIVLGLSGIRPYVDLVLRMSLKTSSLAPPTPHSLLYSQNVLTFS